MGPYGSCFELAVFAWLTHYRPLDTRVGPANPHPRERGSAGALPVACLKGYFLGEGRRLLLAAQL